MGDGLGISSPFCDIGKQRSAGGKPRRACWKFIAFRKSLGKRFHGRDEADVRAACRALAGYQRKVFLSSRSTAAFFRAVVTNTIRTSNACLFGNRLVARNFLFDSFSQPTLAAGVDILVNGVISVGDYLGLGAVTRFTTVKAEGRAA